MKFNNFQIYQYAESLADIFNNTDIYIPVKANFIMQKNISVIMTAAQEIEKTRLSILKHYGELDKNKNSYILRNDKMDEASKEFNDLFNIEQDLPIRTFNLEDLGNVNLSPAQMKTIMFMINDD